MGPILLLALMAAPLLEIAVFIAVGRHIGLWPTLALVALSAITGTALIRHQGVAILGRAEQGLRAGRPPVVEVFDGFCVVAAGLLLATPGFVTDALGLSLLVPGVRTALRRWLSWYLQRRADRASERMAPASPPERSRSGATPVIEGEFERLDESKPRTDAGAHEEQVENKDTPWRHPDR